MRRRAAVSDVVRIGDATCQREEITFAQGRGPLIGRDEEVLSPSSPFEPAFPAQRFDHLVCRLGAAAEQLDNLWPAHLAPFLFDEGQHHHALLRR